MNRQTHNSCKYKLAKDSYNIWRDWVHTRGLGVPDCFPPAVHELSNSKLLWASLVPVTTTFTSLVRKLSTFYKKQKTERDSLFNNTLHMGNYYNFLLCPVQMNDKKMLSLTPPRRMMMSVSVADWCLFKSCR